MKLFLPSITPNEVGVCCSQLKSPPTVRGFPARLTGLASPAALLALEDTRAGGWSQRVCVTPRKEEKPLRIAASCIDGNIRML